MAVHGVRKRRLRSGVCANFSTADTLRPGAERCSDLRQSRNPVLPERCVEEVYLFLDLAFAFCFSGTGHHLNS